MANWSKMAADISGNYGEGQSFDSRRVPQSAALDSAQVQGFLDFLSDINHNRRDPEHRSRASQSLTDLPKDLARDAGPDYNDPYVAASYMVKYHLNHCSLAYWSFKGLFDQLGAVPEALYVFDVGAGTGAGRVGLTLALSERRVSPAVYFDAYDPSKVMLSAGNFFWKSFSKTAKGIPRYKYRDLVGVPDRLPDLSEGVVRVVTAFHLSLPYDQTTSLIRPQQNLRAVLQLVSPDVELFTCHEGKVDVLSQVTGEHSVQPQSFLVPESDGGRGDSSRFYLNVAASEGFNVTDGTAPVTVWSRHRFSLPRKGVLMMHTSSRQERERIAEKERHRAETRRRRALARDEQERRRSIGKELQFWAARRREAGRRAEEERQRLVAERAERQRQLQAEREQETARWAEEERQRQAEALEALERPWRILDVCRDSGEVITAVVIGYNDGGLSVKWEGLEGFVPFSHCRDIAVKDDAALAELCGKSFDFNVLEVERARNRFVLTRNNIRGQLVRDTLSRFTVGQVLDGAVVSIARFGAFVRVADGIEGLVHISELSPRRVEQVSDVVTLNQQVKVRVLRVDLERERLSLSIKDALPDPWDNITALIQVGETRFGEVTNVRDFGLFVRIGEGLEGLVHLSQMGGRKIGDFHKGDKVRVEIIGIEPERKRIPLRLVAVGS